ncbi:hypothetical protein GCM10009661_59030 [Catellatospora chokoriensis]|uniref:Uncharacterized protein n=1 Tax=Catellatospora chokoriensis TaxID=310353 RepID=A0A8J3NVW0_9ACTN|nr:hypothetical protein Cch02nite_61790 [Catellatospora chokoriensis]
MAREPLAGVPDRLIRSVALEQQVMAAIRSGFQPVGRAVALPFEVSVASARRAGGTRSIAVGVDHIGGPLLGLPAPRRAARCAM